MPPDQFAAWAQGARGHGPALDGRGYAELSKPSSYVKPMTYGAVAPGLFDAIVAEPRAADSRQPAAQAQAVAAAAGWSLTMFGKLTWDAIPFNQPIPLITSLVVIAGASAAIAIWITGSRAGGRILWNEYITSTDHKRIGIMYIVLGAGDAGARLCRRDHDARAAVARDRRSRRAICRPSITTRSSPRTARS